MSVNQLQESLINFQFPIPVHSLSDLWVEAPALRRFSISTLGSTVLGKSTSYPGYQRCQEKRWRRLMSSQFQRWEKDKHGQFSWGLWLSGACHRTAVEPGRIRLLGTFSLLFTGSAVLQAPGCQRPCLPGRCSTTVRTSLTTSRAWILSCILIITSNSALCFLRQPLLADVKFYPNRFRNIWSSFYPVALFFLSPAHIVIHLLKPGSFGWECKLDSKSDCISPFCHLNFWGD